MVVFDANTTTPELVDDQKTMMRMALESVFFGLGSTLQSSELARMIKVFAFVPEIEIVLFEALPALERVLGIPVPPQTVREGLFIPCEALRNLLATNGRMNHKEVLTKALLDPEAVSLLAQGKQATALRELIESMLTPELVAS